MDSRATEGTSPQTHTGPRTVGRSPRTGDPAAEHLHAWSADGLAYGARRAAHCLSMAHALVQRPCPAHRPVGRAGPCLLGPGSWADEACQLAEQLARGTTGPVTPPPVEVVGAYIESLRHAASAVYFCRRLQHPHGKCWFDPAGLGGDPCGHVLALAHDVRLSPT